MTPDLHPLIGRSVVLATRAGRFEGRLVDAHRDVVMLDTGDESELAPIFTRQILSASALD